MIRVSGVFVALAPATVGPSIALARGRASVPHLLEALQVLTQLALHAVGDNLLVLAGLHVLLPVQEPLGDLVVQGVLHHGNDGLDLIVGQLTGAVHRWMHGQQCVL